MDRTILKWGIIGGSIAAIYLLLEALFFEKFFFEVNTFNIGKKRSSLPKIKLLLLTDLHFRKWFWPFHEKLMNKINALDPDLILVSGDIIDESGTTTAAAKTFFSGLNFKTPKAVILGNHDLKNEVSIRKYREMFKESNCSFLINKSEVFTLKGARVVVTGLEDFIEGYPSVINAFDEIGTEENHLLLVHSPLQQEQTMKEVNQINALRPVGKKITIQYIFAGHNHGGQVTIFGKAPILPEKSGKYLKGWYNEKKPYLYVSKGFGTSTLPFRFGARSEVTVFKLGV
jgi:predicted MPP superfamily phosphohydrolase